MPGEQLLYQLPNNKVLTTKIGLLSTLREYSRVTNKINKTSQCAQAKYARPGPPTIRWAPTISSPHHQPHMHPSILPTHLSLLHSAAHPPI